MRTTLGVVMLLSLLCPPGFSFQEDAPATETLQGEIKISDSTRLEEVVVQLSRMTGRRGGRRQSVVGRTRPGKDGTFSFPGLVPGRYFIQATLDGFTADGTPVEVGPGKTERPVLELVPARQIRGRITDEKTGKPLSDVEVSAGWGDAANTDKDGNFTIEGLRSDSTTFNLGIDREGYIHRSVVVQTEGGSTQPIDVGALSISSGAVVQVLIRNRDGRTIPGARVRSRMVNAEPYSSRDFSRRQSQTDDSGRTELSGLHPAEPYIIEVTADLFVTGQSTLFRPGEQSSIEVTLSRGRTVAFAVQDEWGEPIPSATLHISPFMEPDLNVRGPSASESNRGGRRHVVTDAGGTCVLDALPHGLLYYRAEAFGCTPRAGILNTQSTSALVINMETLSIPSPTEIEWHESVEDAIQAAQDRNTPMFVAMAMDQEVANDYMAIHHFKDPQITRLARHFSCILTNVFDHAGPDGRCTRYNCEDCAFHQAGETWARETWIGDRSFSVPQHIFVTPSCERIEQHEFYRSPQDLSFMMMRALRRVRPEIAFAESKNILNSLARRLGTDPGARDELVQFIEFGNEFAVSLLHDLGSLGVDAPSRLGIVERIALDRLLQPATAFAPLVRDPSRRVREAACGRLTEVDWDPDVFDLLCRVTAEGTVRAPLNGDSWAVTLALYRGGHVNDPTPIASLLAHSTDDDARNASAYALGRVATGNPEVRNLLISELGRGGWQRTSTARALCGNKPTSDHKVLEALRTAAEDKDALLREEAARCLGIARDFGGKAVLVRLLKDDYPEVRYQASASLLIMGSEVGIPTLLDLLADPVWEPQVANLLSKHLSRLVPATEAAWRNWWASRNNEDSD